MAENTPNYNLEKQAGNDNVNIEGINNNFDIIDAELVKRAELVDGKVPTDQLPEMNYLAPDGDGKDVIVTFVEAGTRVNISTGEKLAILFGKIKKYLTDLKMVAFTGNYSDLNGVPTSLPANGGNAATATKLQTARQINGVAFDGTANITVADSTKAPTSHASTATTYGVGTASNYGHVKTINALTQTSHLDGTALSAYQGKVLNDKLPVLIKTQSITLSKALGITEITGDFSEYDVIIFECIGNISYTASAGFNTTQLYLRGRARANAGTSGIGGAFDFSEGGAITRNNVTFEFATHLWKNGRLIKDNIIQDKDYLCAMGSLVRPPYELVANQFTQAGITNISGIINVSVYGMKYN